MDAFWNFWNSLSQGVRDTIIGGIVLAAILSVWKLFGKSLRAGFRRLFGRIPPPAPTPAPTPALPPQPVVIEVRTPAPPVTPEPAKPVTPAPTPYLPPPPIVGFVARRDTEGCDILERLKEELTPEKRRLVALCGAGGVGKTTLAAEAVRALCDKFVNRLAWVSADGRPEFNLSMLLDEIAAQLGNTELRALPIQQKEEQMRALVAAAPTLVVLDNFETVAETEQKRCADWLSRTPCSTVITSRDEVEQARPVNISAMSLTEARTFVKLLIAQARRPPAFKGLEHDQIIAAAERNPLVLQWIIRQIDKARQPQTVLQELAQGRGDAAQRVFGRSFELLSEDSRAALLALSLFVPSASRPALAEVAGFGDDLTRLDGAVAQSTELWLTNTTEGNERLTIEGLTRELTRATLSKDDRAGDFRQRFVAHFLSYAEAHAQKTAEDFDALEAEKDNLLSAIDAAFDLEDWASVARIRFALEEFLDLHGYWDEAIRSGNQALAAARHSQIESAIAALAHNLAVLHYGRGELDSARRLYDESLEINKRLGNQNGIAFTLHNLAAIAQSQGEIEEARRLYDESLEINKRLGNQSGIAITLHQLAILAEAQGEIEEARRLYNESLEIEKRLGNQGGIAISLHELGRLAQSQGEIEEARRLYNESLEIARGLGDQSGIAGSLHQLAMLAQSQGELEEARQLFNESLGIKKRLGNQRGIASTLHQLGRLAEVENNKVEAARLFREALGIFERLKSPDAEVARRSLERVDRKGT